jgi:hypothetical protein
MNSNWYRCTDCLALWFFQFESGEEPLRFCTDCGSGLEEALNHEAAGPAGGGQLQRDDDPDRRVIEMVRQIFGPDVTEIDPSERWTAERVFA